MLHYDYIYFGQHVTSEAINRRHFFLCKVKDKSRKNNHFLKIELFFSSNHRAFLGLTILSFLPSVLVQAGSEARAEKEKKGSGRARVGSRESVDGDDLEDSSVRNLPRQRELSTTWNPPPPNRHTHF
jgi:hypothetical protein